MSFRYVPGLIRIPDVPEWRPPEGVWLGEGTDRGLYAFMANNSWGYWLIVKAENVCPSLTVDGRQMRPVFSDVNGHVYYEGNGYVYYSLEWECWIHSTKFPGYEPVEESHWDSEKGEYVYTGDAFYTISSIPYDETREERMTPRGSIRNGEAKKLGAVWPRWTCDSEFGEYEGKGGASGKKTLGVPRFRGNGEYFVRSVGKTNSRFTYGRIRYAGGKWTIGEVGSPNGWHEGSEPQVGSAVNFRFCRPEGSDVKGSDISVSFVDWVQGDETLPAYLGEVAVWR